jgi:hypothetical protein
MEHPDAAVRDKATADWCAWEDAVLSGETGGASNPYGDRPPSARLAFVRICTHYFPMVRGSTKAYFCVRPHGWPLSPVF